MGNSRSSWLGLVTVVLSSLASLRLWRLAIPKPTQASEWSFAKSIVEFQRIHAMGRIPRLYTNQLSSPGCSLDKYEFLHGFTAVERMNQKSGDRKSLMICRFLR